MRKIGAFIWYQKLHFDGWIQKWSGHTPLMWLKKTPVIFQSHVYINLVKGISLLIFSLQVLVERTADEQNKTDEEKQKSNKSKAFLTQPRTQSKQSMMSDNNMSIVMSTIAPSYATTAVLGKNRCVSLQDSHRQTILQIPPSLGRWF